MSGISNVCGTGNSSATHPVESQRAADPKPPSGNKSTENHTKPCTVAANGPADASGKHDAGATNLAGHKLKKTLTTDIANKITQLHTWLASKVVEVEKKLLATEPGMPESNARNRAIKLMADKSKGPSSKDLRTSTQAAMVVYDAQQAGNHAKPGFDALKTQLTVLANGTQTAAAGGLSLYVADPKVTAQVLDNTGTQQLLKDVLGNAPKKPEEAVHYFAQLANASSSAPMLANRLVVQALPQINEAIRQFPKDRNKEKVSQALKDLSDIVSSVRNEGARNAKGHNNTPATSSDSEKITDDIATSLKANLGRFIGDQTSVISTWGDDHTYIIPVQTPLAPLMTNMVGEKGADPTLMLRMAQLESDPAIKKSITQGVAAGISDFHAKTFPAALKESGESVAQLTYLNVNFGQMVDKNDPVAMKKYVGFINGYYKDHPDIADKAAVLEDFSTRSAKMMTAAANYHEDLKKSDVSATVDEALNQFYGNEANLQAIQNSPGAISYYSRLDSQVNQSFIEIVSTSAGKNLRLGLQRFGAIATKKTAVAASVLAKQGDLNGAEALFRNFKLEKYGMNEVLFGQPEFNAATDGLLKISFAQDNVNAAKALLAEAGDAPSRAAAQAMLDDANLELADAMKNKPKIGLSWDATTTRGFAMRGSGVALTLAGIWFALQSNDNSAYKWANVGAASAGAAQTIALLSAMSARGLTNDTATLTKLAAFSKGVSLIDTVGDRMILIGPILGTWGMVRDYQNGDKAQFALDATSTVGGLAAFAGTQAWLGGGATELGLVLSTGGLVLCLAAGIAAVGYVGYEYYQSVKASEKFENADTERFLHDVVGIDNGKSPDGKPHDLTRELRNSTRQAFGAGVVLQAAAKKAGYDLNNSADLAAYKNYLNSLTQKQMADMVEGAHEMLDGMNVTSHPTAKEVGGDEAQLQFQSYLKEHKVPLPQIKPGPIPAAEEAPPEIPGISETHGPAPLAKTSRHSEPQDVPVQAGTYTIERGDNLWNVAHKHASALLTEDDKKLIENTHMGKNGITQLALQRLVELNPERHFDLKLRNGVVSNRDGDPDAINVGWKLIVRRE